MRPLDLVLSKLPRYTHHGQTYRACCPAHGGDNPTALSITETGDGAVLVYCFKGTCTSEDILGALGLEWADCFPEGDRRRTRPRSKARSITPTNGQAVDPRKLALKQAVDQAVGLILGPVPNDFTLDGMAPDVSGVLEVWWDIYTEEGTHEAVAEAHARMRGDLQVTLPDFSKALERRLRDRRGQAAGSDVTRLKTYTAAELMNEEFSPKRRVVEPVIVEGLTVLAGKPGLGKSFLALNMALAVAAGGPVLGLKKKVEPGPVLYLALEDNKARMQERIAGLWGGEEAWPTDLHIVHEDVPRLNDGLLPMLEAWLTEHPSARLIVIDILGEVRPLRSKNGDWYEEDLAVGRALRTLAHQYHIAILVLHHTNKLTTPDDPLDAIHGSFGLAGAADTKAVLQRGHGESDATLYARGRDIRMVKLALQFSEGEWTIIGDAEDYQGSETRQKIRAYLRASTTPVMPTTIATSLGISANLARQMLWTMKHTGDVKRVGYGRYTSYDNPNSPNSLNSPNFPNSANSSEEDKGEAIDPPPRIRGVHEELVGTNSLQPIEETNGNHQELGELGELVPPLGNVADPPAEANPGACPVHGASGLWYEGDKVICGLCLGMPAERIAVFQARYQRRNRGTG
jgi:hypothetical protein